MDISKIEQKQTAGDYSVQTQIENQNTYNSTYVYQYNGPSPTEMVSVATTVFNQMYSLTAKNYAEVATATVNERINAFGCELFPRLEKIEGALEKFKDPRFEFLLRDAQIAAAKTDRQEDLCLLSELLSYHVLKGEDRKIDAAISRAIKIIDEIDNDALCALTTACAFEYFSPVSGSISEGLNSLNGLFEKLLYLDLPTGINWLDHLDMLGALRVLPLSVNQSNDYLCSKYAEYACAGIRKDTDEFKIMNDILTDNDISLSNIVENECMDGYVRLNIVSVDGVLPKYKELVANIKSLYSKDNNANNIARDHFIGLWDSYNNLKKVRTWWDRIPNAFDISLSGRVLAQTNAKRVYPSSPDLI